MADSSYASTIEFAQSWADIGVTITPESSTKLDATDISAISHSGTITRGEQRGASGGRKKKRTRGSVAYEASITFYKSGLRKFKQALVDAAPEYARRGNQILIGLVVFDVDVQHSPPGVAEISHVRIKGALMSGYTDDMAEGEDAETVEVPLDVMEVVEVRNGVEIALL